MKLKAGDIFAFRITENEFVCGKVLLDVREQCIKPRRISADSPLVFYSRSILIEIYRETFKEPTAADGERLIPGMFVDPSVLDDEWLIAGYADVDPTRVEFPEGVMGRGTNGTFTRGEISLPVAPPTPPEKMRVYSSIQPAALLPAMCLYLLNRKDEINRDEVEDLDVLDLKHSDLRFSNYRPEVYKCLGEDEKQSYFEMSLRHGFDPRRFYVANSAGNPRGGQDLTLCPYCMSPIQKDVTLCPRCGKDTTKDARFSMTQDEYRAEERKTCKFCGTTMLDQASICPNCRKRQD